MKVSTSHLESVRGLLANSGEQLGNATKAARETEENRTQLDGQVRALQGAFDVCAAAFASQTELSRSQFDSLPPAVQEILSAA